MSALLNIVLVLGLLSVVTADEAKPRATCGGQSVYTAQSGSISFPDDGTNYDNNMMCQWVIQTPGPIRIRFSSLSVEQHSSCRYDALEISSDNGNTLGTYCGYTTPNDLVVSGDRVDLTFSSDYSVTSSGFILHYEGLYDINATPVPGECGIPTIPPSNVDGRIVGGVESTQHSWPWQVDVNYYNYHYCGGSVLNSHWIISAAHCFSNAKESYQLKVGSHYVDSVESNERSYTIEHMFVHEGYGSTYGNDIALLKVTEAIEMNAHVSPVCLPEQGQDWANGLKCYTTGWGNTEGTGDSNSLNQVYVPIIDTDTCNQAHWYNGNVDDTMICAGHEQGGHDSCQGDSGGPLVCEYNGQWVLAGLTSWGYGCADQYNPGVYTHVSQFVNWIEAKMASV